MIETCPKREGNAQISEERVVENTHAETSDPHLRYAVTRGSNCVRKVRIIDPAGELKGIGRIVNEVRSIITRSPLLRQYNTDPEAIK